MGAVAVVTSVEGLGEAAREGGLDEDAGGIELPRKDASAPQPSPRAVIAACPC
jgi:hypothetical protein